MENTSHLHVEFFIEPVENKAKSRTEGRPIFEDQEMVRIKFVGDQKRVHVAPAHEKYKMDRERGGMVTYAEDFPRHYQAFKDGQAMLGEGTPIGELPFLTASKRSELKALNIHTAEALAQLDGTPLTRLGMGGRELKNQAQAYLDHARDGAVEAKLSAENASLREQMEAMQRQMLELMSARPHEPELSMSAHELLPREVAPSSQFEDWPDAELKNFIKQKTGAAPKGNPKHETLVKLADDAALEQAA